MNKKILISISVIFGLLSVLILNELIKAGFIYIIYTKEMTFVLKGITLSVVFSLPETHKIIFDTFIFLTPLLSIIFFIEISAILLSKVYNNNIRTSLIIYQIINIGYLVITTFFNAVSVLISDFLSTDWLTYLLLSKYSTTKSLLITFLIILFIFTYINFATNRIKKYITFIKV